MLARSTARVGVPPLRTRADSSSRDALLASISRRVQAAAALRAVTLRAALNKSSQALQAARLPARRRREVTSDAAVELKRTAADCELRHRRVTTTKQSYAGAAPLSKCLRTGPNIDAAQAHRVPRRHRRRYQGASGRCRRNCRMRKKAYRAERRYSEMLRHIE